MGRLNQRRQRHLTWTKETELFSSVVQQMKFNFAFLLDIKVPESGGSEERHQSHIAWSPVKGLKFPRSQSVWGAMVSADVLSGLRSTSRFSISSLMKMLSSCYSRTWHQPTLPRVPIPGLRTGYFTWPKPIEWQTDHLHTTPHCSSKSSKGSANHVLSAVQVHTFQ